MCVQNFAAMMRGEIFLEESAGAGRVVRPLKHQIINHQTGNFV